MALFTKTHDLSPGQRLHVVAVLCETLGDRCQADWVVQENANVTVNERGSGNDNHIGELQVLAMVPPLTMP